MAVHTIVNYIVKTYVSQEAEDYYTYIANIYSYGGGAHGSSVIITKNIDKKSVNCSLKTFCTWL